MKHQQAPRNLNQGCLGPATPQLVLLSILFTKGITWDCIGFSEGSCPDNLRVQVAVHGSASRMTLTTCPDVSNVYALLASALVSACLKDIVLKITTSYFTISTTPTSSFAKERF